MLSESMREQVIRLLSEIYRSVQWSKMRTSKRWIDIWDHRLRQSATRPTLGEFLSKLCNHLELQALPESALVILEELRQSMQQAGVADDAILNLIYREHSVIAAASAAGTRRKPRQLKLEES